MITMLIRRINKTMKQILIQRVDNCSAGIWPNVAGNKPFQLLLLLILNQNIRHQRKYKPHFLIQNASHTVVCSFYPTTLSIYSIAF